MNLALRMIRRGNGGQPGPELTVLDQNICTIGRRPDCTIPLDDPTLRVSRLHVTIVRHTDGYSLMVSSTTNPVVVNDKVIPQGRSVPLRERDRIAIGEYWFQAEAAPVTADVDVLRGLVSERPGMAAPKHDVGDVQADQGRASDMPWDEAFAKNGQDTTPSIDDLLRKSGLATDPSAPASTVGLQRPVVAQRSKVDQRSFTSTQTFSAQELARSGAGSVEECARIVLEGAGLQGVRISGAQAEDFLRECGAIVRASVEGLMGLLLARATAKDGLKVADRTMVSARENNPLKLISSIEEALQFVLDPTERTDAFLPPARAISDACDDLRIHEIAMMAGMRAALASAVKKFDPGVIERQNQGEGLSFLANRKSRLWDLFVAHYAVMQQEASDDAYRIFEQDFLAAYQEQARRLKR